jgi:hypothetical protein
MIDEEKLSKEAADVDPQSVSKSNDEGDWEGPHDPTNPLNWPTWRKVAIVGIVSAIGFST